jgi:hypothetical protein
VDNDSKTVQQSSREKWELARRDFLIMGSVAVAGAAASSVTASPLTSIMSPVAGSVLSVGFAEQAGADASLVGADQFRAADRLFLRTGARVTVHGVSQPAATRNEPVSIRLSTFFPHLTEEGRLPFLAFTSSLDAKGHRNAGGRVSFVAPLDENGTLPVAIERHEVSSVAMRRLSRMLSFARTSPTSAQPTPLTTLEQQGNVCRLSSGDTGNVRLRPGTYFIALRQSQRDRAPNWSALTIQDGVLDLRKAGRPVDFEYVALSVDYAKA